MEWLMNLIKNNPFVALGLPTSLGSFSFLGNLILALDDGVLDANEIHQLLTSASGLEILLLIIIMVALRNKKK